MDAFADVTQMGDATSPSGWWLFLVSTASWGTAGRQPVAGIIVAGDTGADALTAALQVCSDNGNDAAGGANLVAWGLPPGPSYGPVYDQGDAQSFDSWFQWLLGPG